MTQAGPSRHADVIVIGAGIMGLTAALHMARSGLRVTVVDRKRAMAEASGVNAGSLGVQNKLTPLLPYALEALEIWRGMSADLGTDIGFRNAGGWRVATTSDDKDALHRSAMQQQKAGVKIEWHDHNAIRVNAPFLGHDVVAATHSAQDSYANPLLFAHALRNAVLEAGVELLENTQVLGLEHGQGFGQGFGHGGAWNIRTADRTLCASQVLIAAGAWAGKILEMVDVAVPLGLDINVISVTEPTATITKSIVFHVRGILTVKQIANGTCLIGGGWQGSGSLESDKKDIDYESALHNIRLATSVLPGIRHLNVVRQWCGFEGVTPDSLPYFGQVPGCPGLSICACVRGGWTLGPLFGRLAAELVTRGHTRFPVDDFALSRFSNEVCLAKAPA